MVPGTHFCFCHSAPLSSSVGTSIMVPMPGGSIGARTRMNSSRITAARSGSEACSEPP